MNLTDELQRLGELHERGLLTADEFARAKATVLAGESPEVIYAAPTSLVPNPPPDAHLQRIEWQNELARIDREWEMERQQYMAVDKYGNRSEPNAAGSMIGGAVAAVFGLFWTGQTFSLGAPPLFSCFGLVFVGFGVYSFLNAPVAADKYKTAHTRYQERRAALLRQHDETALHREPHQR